MRLPAPVERTLDVLERLRSPTSLSVDAEGRRVAAAVFPAYREPGRSFESRVWVFALGDGEPLQVTHGPGTDTLPALDPKDGRLAFASDRDRAGKLSVYLLDSVEEGGPARRLADLPGTVEALAWLSDGSALLALAADEGLDSAATDGAVRYRWSGAPPDPDVSVPHRACRRLYRVDASTGEVREVGPNAWTVWEFASIDRDRAVALVSRDPSERGWYRSRLAVLDLVGRTLTELYVPTWQLQSVAVSPDGGRVAVVEGWSSDRGLVAGDPKVLDLRTGAIVAEPEIGDVSSVSWRDDSSLWFAGWRETGSRFGSVSIEGKVLWEDAEDAIVGTSSFAASVVPIGDDHLVSVRETERQPSEVVVRAATDGAPWRPISGLNEELAGRVEDYPEVREVSWEGIDGLEIRGLLLLPLSAQGPLPMIVGIHGGPTWSWKHGFNPGYALPYAAAGYAVLLPNYRGSTGRGQEFTRLNVGDPGGEEFEDILQGVEWAVREGVAAPGRVGVTGGSYGGYLTAWAVTRSDRFAAAVMVSGISNQLSCHWTCNHAFFEWICGGTPDDRAALERFVQRSPITHVAAAGTPTLIIHGNEDLCTPVGQAVELYNALVLRAVPTELVVYPREGHGLREREHQRDAWRRSIAWFDRYLKAGE